MEGLCFVISLIGVVSLQFCQTGVQKFHAEEEHALEASPVLLDVSALHYFCISYLCSSSPSGNFLLILYFQQVILYRFNKRQEIGKDKA